ncbi:MULTISPECIES: hypothetical protein [unclassified Clostridioides]|uniref:hypothetical protein n=1 Tax=unclassified Clostridioides TaxID=2635829 RepID=UPI001D115F63|nr:hypothetical protein [Clostridioides sp. ES-S-0145-01]MCC0681823.1 hypothetical protein [Clostridioides sp. ES-S-0005-03]MCC0708487.1 hypothetical protein [Clostridioides sp. ES-S-0190-01]UDN64021.1 hypothetical protein IC758_20740 [Clostridioides sp. ES-W-0016-02]
MHGEINAEDYRYFKQLQEEKDNVYKNYANGEYISKSQLIEFLKNKFHVLNEINDKYKFYYDSAISTLDELNDQLAKGNFDVVNK